MLYQFIFYLVICLIIDYVANSLFKAKINIKQRILFIFMIAIFLMSFLKLDFRTILKSITSYRYIDALIKSIIIILIHFSYIQIAYKTKIKDNLILSCLSLGIITLALTISDNFYLDLTKRFPFSYYSVDSAIHLSATVIDFLLWLIFLKIYKETKNISSLKSLFPISIIAITILSILYMINFKLTSRAVLSFAIIIILINYLIIYSYMHKLSEIRLNVEKKKLEMESNYYKEIAKMQIDHYDNSFNFIHNLIAKVKTAKELLANQEIDEATKQVEEVHNDLIKEFNIIYTNSRTISSVINNHLKEITDNNIKLKTTIRYTDFTFMDDLDAIKLFDKLLVLMLENVKNVESDQRFINISTSIVSSCLLIKLIYSQDKASDNAKSLTDIKKLVDKYHGQLSIKDDLNNNYSEIDLIYNISIMNDNMSIENKF